MWQCIVAVQEHDDDDDNDDQDGWCSGMENPCTWMHRALPVELITTTGEVLHHTGASHGRLTAEEMLDAPVANQTLVKTSQIRCESLLE